MENEDLLVGIEEIGRELRMSPGKARRFIRANPSIPVRKDGSWFSHRDELRDWFRGYVRRRTDD